jgi:hypothetical protein
VIGNCEQIDFELSDRKQIAYFWHYTGRIGSCEQVVADRSNSKYEEGFEKQTQVEQKTGIMAT